MSTLISSIAILSLIGMVFVYPMYFLDLSAFGKVMARDHPDLVGQRSLSLGDAYKLLQRVKAGRLGDVSLSTEALDAHSRAKRLLHLGLSLFFVFLLIGLTDAVLSKHVGRA